MASGQIKISEKVEPGEGFAKLSSAALLVGGIGIVLAVLLGYFSDHSLSRFFHAYLVGFSYVLSISLGAIFFVLIQHATRAGWSVAVRRTAENLAGAMPVVAALSLPIVISVLMHNGSLYGWSKGHAETAEVSHEGATTAPAAADHAAAETAALAVHEEHDVQAGKMRHNPELEAHEAHLIHGKSAFLNPGFFVLRLVIYFAVWSGLALWYRRRSIDQDESGDLELTNRMQWAAPASLIALALTLTLGAFDLIMSLDAAWFSTMFGVYYFAGCAVSIFASLIIILTIFQNCGYLTQSLTNEHFHDLGKFLFAFTFFWGYIAFSQFMLIWYAAIPEEVGWYARRGASTIPEHISGWTTVSLVLLFCHLLIPFVGLLSRHIKRKRATLVFWAVWMLVFHWLDLLWLIMPEYKGNPGHVSIGLVEVLCFVGVLGVYISTVARLASKQTLRPVADPRLADSIAFTNI